MEESKPSIREITDSEFESLVLQRKEFAIVKIWAEWCAPCRGMKSLIEEVAKDYGDQILFCSMNIETTKIHQNYQVGGVPMLLAFHDGELVESRLGSLGRERIVEWCDQLVEKYTQVSD